MLYVAVDDPARGKREATPFAIVVVADVPGVDVTTTFSVDVVLPPVTPVPTVGLYIPSVTLPT